MNGGRRGEGEEGVEEGADVPHCVQCSTVVRAQGAEGGGGGDLQDEVGRGTSTACACKYVRTTGRSDIEESEREKGKQRDTGNLCGQTDRDEEMVKKKNKGHTSTNKRRQRHRRRSEPECRMQHTHSHTPGSPHPARAVEGGREGSEPEAAAAASTHTGRITSEAIGEGPVQEETAPTMSA